MSRQLQSELAEEQPSSRALLTVAQFAEKHRAFSQGSLRYLIFNEKTNGLSPAIFRIGRKVLIDEGRFFDWMDRQNNETA